MDEENEEVIADLTADMLIVRTPISLIK